MNRLIDEETSKVLKTRFAEILVKDVNIQVYTDGTGEYADFTLEFMKELAEITPKVKPVILPMDDGRKTGYQTDPTLVIGKDLGYQLVFNGTPAGHEANTIIETIVQLSSDMAGFSPNEDALLQNLDKPVKLQVFVTTSCPYCPQSATLAFKLAMANPKFISAEVVEAQENQELALKYDIKSVPMQVINGDPASVTVGVQQPGKWILQILKYGFSGYEALEKQLVQAKAVETALTDRPDGVVTLTDTNIEEALKKYPKLVIDCWAEWCGPCRLLTPVIDELAKEHSGRVVYGKINVDENPETSMKYKIESIPSLLLFNEGVLTDTLVGAKPKAELLKDITEKMKLIAL
jgi:thioredoxin 1